MKLKHLEDREASGPGWIEDNDGLVYIKSPCGHAGTLSPFQFESGERFVQFSCASDGYVETLSLSD